MTEVKAVIEGNKITHTFWSLDEIADYAQEYGLNNSRRVSSSHLDDDDDYHNTWRGGSFTEILDLARNGWESELAETLDIAESAVELCERTHEVIRITEPVFDVSGSDVDISRYLAGEPECMVDYPLQRVSASGKIITLCAGGFYSAAVSAESLMRRGRVITALALALSRLGHSIELWVDVAMKLHGNGTGHIKVCVKGPDDTLDPARIMFAYAHPGMFRGLGFAVVNSYPERFYDSMYGLVGKVDRDLPEGTIYLEGVGTWEDVPDAHETLKKYLRDLKLLESE